ELDRPRAWEVMLEVVKASNAAKDYTGDDGRLTAMLETKNMAMATANSAESFDLNDIFARLAREDLQRAVDLARTFDGEAPRAAATLAIARSVLDKGEKKQERAATNRRAGAIAMPRNARQYCPPASGRAGPPRGKNLADAVE